MKRQLMTLFSLLMVVIAVTMMSSFETQQQNSESQQSELFDEQRSNMESYIESAGSGSSILPELQHSLPSPSVRLISSQKKSQQNSLTFSLLKQFSAEVIPTNNYNKNYSYPLSAKENLIVIIKHIII